MFFLFLAALVSADTVRINTVPAGKSIKLMMGGAEQAFDVDAYGRMYWADHPSTSVITLIIGDDSYDLKTSRSGVAGQCNYNFDLYSDTEMYQNYGMECTKLFEKAPGAIELLNDVGKSVYPAFNTGWGFSSDSVAGWLEADTMAVYTSKNPYLSSINVKDGTELEVGYYDQSEYKSCGQATVGQEFIKMLSECTGVVGSMTETKVGGSYDDHCGCMFAYCESQLSDTSQCCEYYREPKNTACKGETTLGNRMHRQPGVDYDRSTVAEASQTTSFSADDWAIYGFAAIGIGALAQQAYKMVVKKNSETTPLYQDV